MTFQELQLEKKAIQQAMDDFMETEESKDKDAFDAALIAYTDSLIELMDRYESSKVSDES